jgi:hypothetical protein
MEWFDDDSGCEVATFAEPNARHRAIRYADRQYGDSFSTSLPIPGPSVQGIGILAGLRVLYQRSW